MMKCFSPLLPAMAFFIASVNASANDLDFVRANYNKFAFDKDLCKKMISDLLKLKNNSATHLAYLGALKAIWANHVFNPIGKLNTFKEGKEYIERAIRQQPNNVELRFIRLSVQKNAPSFLGYSSNVEEDTEFINKNSSQVDSVLKKNIELILKK